MNTKIERLGLTALEAVRPPRGTRKLATALVGVFAILPPTLLLAPWRQNVTAQGRVTALDPLDRVQIIPAPVTGRLVELNVQEGVFVEEGQVLARMADQDPLYEMRLQQRIGFSEDDVRAAKNMVELYKEQVALHESARDQAIAAARFDYNVAKEKVNSAKLELEGLEADYAQKKADYERKTTLAGGGVVSELDLQKAESDFLNAEAKVGAAKAKVEQARNNEQSKEASMSKVASDMQAKVESVKSSGEEAKAKVASAEKSLAAASTTFDRQQTQVITASRSGYVLRVYAASNAELLSQGDPLIELIPDTSELAVELWVRGVDSPLITPGREVRLQFEGWPAVQFAGWPSVAVGTFGGLVRFVDAQGGTDGRFRVLVVPDPKDDPWPEGRFLRQGVRANGWLLLDTVSVGFELWRNMNAFPPSVDTAPDSGPAKGGSKKKVKKDSSKGDGSSKDKQ